MEGKPIPTGTVSNNFPQILKRERQNNLMATKVNAASRPGGRPKSASVQGSVFSLLIKYMGLCALNALGLIFIYAFLDDDNFYLAVLFAIITLAVNVVILVPRFFSLRWVAPGLLLAMLFVIYPVLYTVLTSFTNYGDGHMLTKAQMIALIARQQFIPSDAQAYSWAVYGSEDGSYALWLSSTDEEGNPTAAFAQVDRPIEDIASPPEDPPEQYDGYRQLSKVEQTQALGALQNTVFGTGDDTAMITNLRLAARPLAQRYVYSDELDVLLDQQTDTLYVSDDNVGLFVPEDGTADDALVPGYRANIGLANFERLVRNRALLGPLFDVFSWTVTYAVLAVILSFAFGLFMAIVLDHPFVLFRKFWRSLIFIPYAIPAVISILVWRGLLNQNLGLVTTAIADLTGYRVPWFNDPTAAKIAIIMVDLWLGYPYMMLVCSGALKAIPKELYEAAAVDGAEGWRSFRSITLPLLLISVGPLLIASFTYTFNNYLLIELLTGGKPPRAGTLTPAGHTDILISYTYNLAFKTGEAQNADYGYAAAITFVIFAVMVVITLFNFRFVNRWERISENV